MHRHGYQGRKFGRQRDQRQALTSGLASSLVLEESMETTLPKAKETMSYLEKLVSKAKKGGLHQRRQVVAQLNNKAAANKLFDEVAPKLSGRASGHFRISRTTTRRGDGAQLAKITFVDDLKKPAPKPVPKTAKPKAKPTTKTEPKAKVAKPKSGSKR